MKVRVDVVIAEFVKLRFNSEFKLYIDVSVCGLMWIRFTLVNLNRFTLSCWILVVFFLLQT